jgi:mannan endo-1,4-beta-mannosidase
MLFAREKIVILIVTFFATGIWSNTPVNPNASQKAKDILNYMVSLRKLTQNRVVSGQFLDYGNNANYSTISSIQSKTGKVVGLVGGDYRDYNSNSIRYDKTNQALTAASKGGSLVALNIHMLHPDGGDLRDKSFDIAKLLKPGTQTYKNWFSQLDQIAAGLKQLQANDVVVLFRPFHEMNGDWFWWNGKDTLLFVQVWKQVYHYYTDSLKLNNLLWVYGPNIGGKVLSYYPGDDFVDVVGLDGYTSTITPTKFRGYAELSRIKKPFGLTEFGPENADNPSGNFDYLILLKGLRDSLPNCNFFMSWNSNWSLNRNVNVKQFLTDPMIANQEEVKAGVAGAVEDTMAPPVMLSSILTYNKAHMSITAVNKHFISLKGSLQAGDQLMTGVSSNRGKLFDISGRHAGVTNVSASRMIINRNKP